MARIDLDSQNPSTPPSRGGYLKRLGLVAALAALAAGGGYWFARKAPTATPAPPPAAPPPGAITSTAPVGTAVATPTATPSATPTSTSTSAPAAAPATGPRRLSITVAGPLEEAFVKALGPAERSLAAELAQVANRLLVWHLDVARDARSGDTLELIWSPAPAGGSGPTHSQEPVIEALRYASQKRGKTFAAYRFQAPGAKFARYYGADGVEVEERLVDGPIREYEQVTSLVKDGRRHKGVDFRTAVGTPVYAPFDGTIERRNWKFSVNGNCLDLADPATGRHAIFLHLDVIPQAMAIGRAVRKGEQIAGSGNSGHSTAPHLHYQLEDSSGKVLDPFKVHQTTRASLPAAARAAFEAERARLDAKLGG
jgi:murein DD-endopeptidase MepM/ murein hydrolase activator NlpD